MLKASDRALDIAVRKYAFFGAILMQNDHFAKTGSGQT
jgi:hypothetical protein